LYFTFTCSNILEGGGSDITMNKVIMKLKYKNIYTVTSDRNS